MKTKKIKFNGQELTLLRYEEYWVFPVFRIYSDGLGNPIAMQLYCLEDNSLEFYGDVTVNLPDCQRSAGCQFINTNKNKEGMLEWLEEHKFGERTGNSEKSGLCTYPEFNFYKGVNYWIYRNICEDIGW